LDVIGEIFNRLSDNFEKATQEELKEIHTYSLPVKTSEVLADFEY
jgi:hypothetical protein